jgi:hypothetical protein
MPSSPDDIKKIKKAIKEAADSQTRIDAEKDFIKDVGDALKVDYAMPRQLYSKLVRVYHKQNYSEESAKSEEFEILYETVFPPTNEG